MYNVQYYEDMINDDLGYPRDFQTEEEIALYLEKYKDLDYSKITVIDIGTFEFELPGIIQNRCKPGYLRSVFQVARQVNRYRNLQGQLDWLGHLAGANPDFDETYIILTEDYHGVPYSFLWTVYDRKYRNDPKHHFYHGGLIMNAPNGFYTDKWNTETNQREFTFDFSVPWGKNNTWGLHE